YYYAGSTKITDRSLEILGQMDSLVQVELSECEGVTGAALVHLAALPRLREVELAGLPGVTLAGTRVFPVRVRVKYWTWRRDGTPAAAPKAPSPSAILVVPPGASHAGDGRHLHAVAVHRHVQ